MGNTDLTVIYDRDPGDEDDSRVMRISTDGLCAICKEDAALPDEDICAGCLAELQYDLEKEAM